MVAGLAAAVVRSAPASRQLPRSVRAARCTPQQVARQSLAHRRAADVRSPRSPRTPSRRRLGAGCRAPASTTSCFPPTAGAQRSTPRRPRASPAEAAAALKVAQRRSAAKPTKKQLDALAELAHRVEMLWQFDVAAPADRRGRRSAAHIPMWGRDTAHARRGAARADRGRARTTNGAYRRLRRVMDAWCALWFWPLTDDRHRHVRPPNSDQWIERCKAILGRAAEGGRRHRTSQPWPAADWEDLDRRGPTSPSPRAPFRRGAGGPPRG